MLQYVEQRMKVFSRVAWPDMGGRGCYNGFDPMDEVKWFKTDGSFDYCAISP
jgi:hypothetical protein